MVTYVRGGEVVPERDVDLLDRITAVVRGVVHEDADRTEFVCAACDHRPQRAGVTDVARHEKRRAAQFGLELSPTFDVNVNERYPRTLPSKLANEFGTQA